MEVRADLAYARALLEAYQAPDEQQASVRKRMLDFMAEHPGEAHKRSCLPGHLTGSALAVDREREKVLLTHHKKLGRWLQLGGHCDGDANLRGVSWREAHEESGILPVAIGSAPIDLDIHVIPARPGEPEHLHLDTRYLVELQPGASEVLSEESNSLGWFTVKEALELDIDDSLRRLLLRSGL